MMISNITTPWGLEESNLVFMNQASSGQQMQQILAPWRRALLNQDAEQMGLAWTDGPGTSSSGTSSNNGNDDMVQTDGFIKGTIDRWNWLQEMAMTNDDLLSNPADWPVVEPGDDIAGHQCLAFYADSGNGNYVNISKQLGPGAPRPTDSDRGPSQPPTPSGTVASTSRSPASGDRPPSTPTSRRI